MFKLMLENMIKYAIEEKFNGLILGTPSFEIESDDLGYLNFFCNCRFYSDKTGDVKTKRFTGYVSERGVKACTSRTLAD